MRIRHRFSWSLAGNGAYAVSQWLVLVATSRLGDVGMLGRYGLGLALCAPVLLLTNMGLRNAVATDVRREYALGAYLRARTVGTAVAVVLLVLIVVGRRDPMTTVLAIALVGTAKVIEAFSDLTYGVFQRAGRNDLFARSLLARAVLGLGSFVVALELSRSLPVALASMCAAWTLVLVVHDQPLMRVHAGEPAEALRDGGRWKQLSAAAAPLGVVAALVSLGINLPRYAVDTYLGERALGVFTAVSYFLVIVSVLVVAAAQATLTSLSACWARGDVPAFRRLLLQLCLACGAVGGVGLLGAAVAGNLVLTRVFGASFEPFQPLLLQTMGAAALSAVAGALGVGAMATRRFGRLLLPHGVIALVTLAVSFFLVSRWELRGAGWALVAAMALSLIPPSVVLASATPERRA